MAVPSFLRGRRPNEGMAQSGFEGLQSSSGERGDTGPPGIGPINGVPGVTPTIPSDELGRELLIRPTSQRRVGDDQIHNAITTLTEYQMAKANLEQRVVEDEEWYKLRHWEIMRRKKQSGNPAELRPEPNSAWLFNGILNKHADTMDNYPEPNVLPREKSDEESAKTLSAILPTIIERNGYKETYSANAWEKLKHGTSVYGVFWNKTLDNGLGDVDIRGIDLLNIFWEPGITDIQKSRNLFIVDLKDNDLLESEYPQLKGNTGSRPIEIKQYVSDENIDLTNKSLVVDWYYKVRSATGRTLLHYVKFVGNTILFASENEAEYTESGWYDHGQYPVVLDTLFPEKGTPVGFGYISITKDPQLYIDKLGQNILESSLIATKRRYFISDSAAINEEELLDNAKPAVHVAGAISDDKLRPMEVPNLSSVYMEVLQSKIDEMKETSANRDFSSGGSTSGVTAAAAIAALQEAGNKVSRDMISASYTSHEKVCYLCIELIRQFYDEVRSFRITGQGESDFVDFSNESIKEQVLPPTYEGQEPIFRVPIFDIVIKAQKKSPYSRMSQNELAKELYNLGVFEPERAQQALAMLEMMDFEGKEGVVEYVTEGQTLYNIVMQQQQQIMQMGMQLQAITGGMAPMPGMPQGAPPPQEGGGSGGNGLARAVTNAERANQGSYAERIASRSVPNMDNAADAAVPR